jgi:FimV-like protein
MKEQLIHILDQSVCLTRKQMKEYLSGAMLPEEAHAAEVHLSSCPLCSMAMEGFEEHSEQALAAISALNSGFLKEHFDNISPQIHLNSMAPAATIHQADRRRTNVQPFWRVGSIAAALLLLLGLVWAYERRHKEPSVVMNAVQDRQADPAGRGSTGQSNGAMDNQENGSSSPAAVPPAATTSAATTSSHTQEGPAKKTSGANTGTASGAGSATVKQTSGPANAAAASGAASSSSSEAVAANTGITPKPPVDRDKATPDMSLAALPPKPATHYKKEYNPAEDGDDGKKEADSKSAAASSKNDSDSKSDEEDTNAESYSKGSLEAALSQYKKDMNSTDQHTRYHAMIMAAQCYSGLGNKKQARVLLQRVIDGGSGSERRQARRALHKLQ